MQIPASEMNSMTKSLSDTASMLFSHKCSNPSTCRVNSLSSRIGGAGQGRRAQRHGIHALVGIGKPFLVPAEHLIIGHEMVGEQHGLGPLQMGVPGMITSR
jgi:hypothetical protein